MTSMNFFQDPLWLMLRDVEMMTKCLNKTEYGYYCWNLKNKVGNFGIATVGLYVEQQLPFENWTNGLTRDFTPMLKPSNMETYLAMREKKVLRTCNILNAKMKTIARRGKKYLASTCNANIETLFCQERKHSTHCFLPLTSKICAT
eukprot:817832_1